MVGEFVNNMKSSKNGKHQEVYCKTCKIKVCSDDLKRDNNVHINKQNQELEVVVNNIGNSEKHNETVNNKDMH